jgi:hypothetical protein
MSVQQQLEVNLKALELLQQWSIWTITVAVTVIGALTFVLAQPVRHRERTLAAICFLALLGSVVTAVFLVSALPAVSYKILEPSGSTFFGVEVPGIYKLTYFGIPIWVLSTIQRTLFIISILTGAAFVWRRTRP